MKRRRLAGSHPGGPWVSERRLTRDLWRILSYIHEANAVISNNLHKEMENCPWRHSAARGAAAIGRFRDPYPDAQAPR